MENLGITKEILIIAFIGLMTTIIFLFAFILVGVAAFSIPGTFGSIVNSIFPAGIFYIIKQVEQVLIRSQQKI